MRVFHSSNVIVKNPDVAHSRNFLDFGKGFYVTTLRLQAEQYARRFTLRGAKAFLNEYELDEMRLAEFSVKRFDSYEEDWLNFVMKCRSGLDESAWDVVVGGVANDKIFRTVDLYFAGDITKGDALRRLSFEKPNNQIGVTVQNLTLAMHGQLVDHLFDYNQNGLLGLLPDVGTDATSPLPTAEAFYQLGMVAVAQRTVFEAQEAILDFQKSGRCYKRLAQTYLIQGDYAVARKYLAALQKTLFYRAWANETLPLLGDEAAIDKHPEYGRLRQMDYKEDFYFGDHVTADMLERLYFSNTDNRLAFQYLVAYYMLTGDRDGYTNLLQKIQKP